MRPGARRLGHWGCRRLRAAECSEAVSAEHAGRLRAKDEPQEHQDRLLLRAGLHHHLRGVTTVCLLHLQRIRTWVFQMKTTKMKNQLHLSEMRLMT